MKRARQGAVGVWAAFVVCVVFAGAGAGVVRGQERAKASRALREGDFERAEKSFRELMEKNPRDAEARLGLSFALLKQRRTQEAFDAAARVVAVDPANPRAHALLGSALLAAGDFRLSVEEFRTALSFKEDEAMAIAGLAMVDFYENRLGQSLHGLRRAAFIDGDEPDYHFHLGQVAARHERFAEAADAYERFLRIAPKTDADRRARIRGLIDFLRYLGNQRALLRASGPSRVRVPFEVVNNRPIVRVHVNDSKEPLRFVVDTGAGMCVISDEAADRLNLRPVARGGMARAVGGGGRFEIVYGFLNSLQLGEARVESVPVYIRRFFNPQEKIDGYVGLSVVGKYLTTFDYAGGAMTMLRDSERERAEAELRAAPLTAAPHIEIPIRMTSSGFWSGEVKIEGVGKPLNFIVDTGATISVVSTALAAREEMLARFAQPSARLTVFGAAGVTPDVQVLSLPRVQLGALTRSNVRAAVLDMDAINETAGFEQTGILGGNVLSDYRVIFDFSRSVVRLEPARATPTPAEAATPVAPAVANQP
ncbi:MAG TPA: aspartyl protease family protein [Pyrinomonadaceae bacterium]|nr:aspartyl protease family protein [Pyrinomonadaceae bacterium]